MEKVKEVPSLLKNSHGLPVLNPTAVGTTTGYLTRTLPTEIVTSLRKAARNHGCSIFSLLWSAMCIGILRIHPPTAERLEHDITNPGVGVPMNLRHLTMTDPFDRSQWQTRLSFGHTPHIARNLGRFVHLNRHAQTQEVGHQLLVQDVWTLAKEIASQLEENKKYTERAAVWIEEMLAVLTRVMGGSIASADPSAPTLALLNFSSIGVIDPYLSETHSIPTGGSLVVSSPRIGTTCYTAFSGLLLVFHAHTWKGEMVMNYSFSEASSGTVQEQQKAWEEGKRIKDGDASAVVVEFAEEFVDVLRIVAKLSA